MEDFALDSKQPPPPPRHLQIPFLEQVNNRFSLEFGLKINRQLKIIYTPIPILKILNIHYREKMSRKIYSRGEILIGAILVNGQIVCHFSLIRGGGGIIPWRTGGLGLSSGVIT